MQEGHRPLGVALRDPHPWRDLAGLATSAEALGYRALFLPEVGARDTLVTLGALSAVTERIELASGVVPLGARSVQLLAMAAATVQEASSGRLILGLGTGQPGPGALDRLRRTVAALRSLFETGRAELDGGRRRLGPLPEPQPPIWLAALGPRAVRLAGEIADGVILNWCTPERVERAVGEIAEGAASAGRAPDELTVAVYVRACVSEDSDAAVSAVAAAAAEYASYPAYARQFASMGLGQEAAAAAATGAAGVPPRLVREVAAAGPARGARSRLEEYRRAGASLPIVYPVPIGTKDLAGSVLATMRELAPSG